jgi:hypothetical protein
VIDIPSVFLGRSKPTEDHGWESLKGMSNLPWVGRFHVDQPDHGRFRREGEKGRVGLIR